MSNNIKNMKIDKKDRKIIAELVLDSRQTTGKLSKKLNIPVTTVHNRIKKLIKMGVIKALSRSYCTNGLYLDV